MGEWQIESLGNIVTLQRGHDLPSVNRRVGSVPVVGSSGVSGFHDTALYEGPGVAIGRSGASIGCATWVSEAYWPLNTTLFVRDFKGNEPRWVFRVLHAIDFMAFNSGSAQPSLNRNYLTGVMVNRPPLETQRAIADVLSSLDDKIAANKRIIETQIQILRMLYRQHTRNHAVASSSVHLIPILGGTPSRASSSNWDGAVRWASVTDVTAAPNGILFSTAEGISAAASRSATRLSAHPAGSVVLSARGTVGTVAQLEVEAAANQSCYVFRPGVIPAACLRPVVEDMAGQALSHVHGSVFDTITMSTFRHLSIPELTSAQWSRLESELSPHRMSAALLTQQSIRLAATRDELLPLLMSGRISVREAEEAAP